uniref:Thioredoxin domain-containing protein n=1 Tax=Octactis speculum TaxID=3111310 RepID=A0A6U3VX16_9STRA
MLAFATVEAFQPLPHMGWKGSRQVARKLSEGDSIPMDFELFILDDDNAPTAVPAKEVFSGKKVVVFGLPGSLTPTCSEAMLPAYIEKVDEFKSKGVDTVACLAVNDPFVMGEMSRQKDPEKTILMLGDGSAAFTKALGLEFDTAGFGGVRCRRCAFVVEDGKATTVKLEEGGKFSGVAGADSILSFL